MQERESIHVVKGKHAHHPIALGQVRYLHNRLRIRDEVPMSQHHAARLAGTARGVDDGGKIHVDGATPATARRRR